MSHMDVREKKEGERKIKTCEQYPTAASRPAWPSFLRAVPGCRTKEAGTPRPGEGVGTAGVLGLMRSDLMD